MFWAFTATSTVHGELATLCSISLIVERDSILTSPSVWVVPQLTLGVENNGVCWTGAPALPTPFEVKTIKGMARPPSVWSKPQLWVLKGTGCPSCLWYLPAGSGRPFSCAQGKPNVHSPFPRRTILTFFVPFRSAASCSSNWDSDSATTTTLELEGQSCTYVGNDLWH